MPHVLDLPPRLDPRLDYGALLDRAEAFIAAGRPIAARPLLATLRRAGVEPVAVAALSVRVALADGDVEAALAAIAAGMADEPGDGRLYVLRAEVLARAGRLHAALQDAAEAVTRMPRDIVARASFGMLLLQTAQPADAVAVLRDLWHEAPRHPGIAEALALAHELADDLSAAADVLQEAGRATTDSSVHLALMQLHLRHDAPARAVVAGQAARDAGVADTALLGLLGHACALSGDHAAGAAVIARAVAEHPADTDLRDLAAVVSLGAPPPGDRWDPGYARSVFDLMADRFDARMAALGCEATDRLRDMIAAALPPGRGTVGPVLDLGCGTGRLAAALATLTDPKVGPIEGVDLSPAMLAHAAGTGLYTRLVEADLADYLARGDDAPRFALVCAADVFCYLGDLAPTLAGVTRRLSPGGLVLFTAEVATAAEPTCRGWVLRPSGRFAHAAPYLRQVVADAGLTLLSLAQHGLRREYGRTLPAHYVVARAA